MTLKLMNTTVREGLVRILEKAAVRKIIPLSLQSDGSSRMIQRHQVPAMSSRMNGSSSSAGKCHRISHKSGGHGLGIDQRATELNVMSIDLAFCVPATALRMNGSSSSASNCHRTSHESGGQHGTELNVRLIDLAFQTVFTAWEHDHMTYSMCSGIAKSKVQHSSFHPRLQHHSPMAAQFDQFSMTWQWHGIQVGSPIQMAMVSSNAER